MFDQSAADHPVPAALADGRAVEVWNAAGRAPVLVLCDHAGRWVPPELEGLGLPPQELARHIAWDIGAAAVARDLACRLDAPAVLCHVCRLVIDPNRKPGDPSSIPTISDGTFVPGNQDLASDAVRERVRRYFLLYHRTIARAIARLRRRHGVVAIVAVHSFTPRMAHIHSWRPWHVAVLWDRDPRLAAPALAALRREPGLEVGDNEPYSGRFPIGYSIPFHAARPRLPHVTFELRQDLIDTEPGAALWAERLAAVLRAPLADPALYAVHDG
jgi:predicted N-formylglutamate amidohydrolase